MLPRQWWAMAYQAKGLAQNCRRSRNSSVTKPVTATTTWYVDSTRIPQATDLACGSGIADALSLPTCLELSRKFKPEISSRSWSSALLTQKARISLGSTHINTSTSSSTGPKATKLSRQLIDKVPSKCLDFPGSCKQPLFLGFSHELVVC